MANKSKYLGFSFVGVSVWRALAVVCRSKAFCSCGCVRSTLVGGVKLFGVCVCVCEVLGCGESVSGCVNPLVVGVCMCVKLFGMKCFDY